jgi:hypothetical protein
MANARPRIVTRGDFDRLITSCRDIDGSKLIETLLRLQWETGNRLQEVLQMAEFRTVLNEMLSEVRGKAGVA